MKDKKMYSIDCECSNCGCDGTVSFRKGEEVPYNFPCPNCGCMTARKKTDSYKRKKDKYIPWTEPPKPWKYDKYTWQPKDIMDMPRIVMSQSCLCNT